MAIFADFIGIFFAFFFIKSQIDELIVTLQFPKQLNFYFLFFWAFVSALAGGFVWNLISRVTKTNVILTEPRGWSPFGWAIISNLPTVITLLMINIWYPYSSLKQQVLLFFFFFLGMTIGAVVFYSIPLRGHTGFRSFLSQGTGRTSSLQEFLLSLIWTSLLSIGFVPMNIIKFITNDSITLLETGVAVLWQAGIFISITVMSIMFGLLAFPRRERTETALGIIAGLFVKIALFFSLLFT